MQAQIQSNTSRMKTQLLYKHKTNKIQILCKYKYKNNSSTYTKQTQLQIQAASDWKYRVAKNKVHTIENSAKTKKKMMTYKIFSLLTLYS